MDVDGQDGPQGAWRCAVWAREAAVDPIGTAASADGWLLLDWPLPWPRDVAEVAALQPLRAALAGSGIRLQLVVTRPDDERRTVVLHDRPADPGGWFGGFRRRARSVAPAELIATAVELVAGRDDGLAPSTDLPPAPLDLLVCGHGSRDRCCGSLGTALALASVAEGLAVRRTSHTGGHRFAPTGLVLPQGTSWAFLDEGLVRQIATASGPLGPLLAHYRGSVAFPTPELQAAEREAFAVVGWSWLQHRRRARTLGDGRVRVDSSDPSGHRRSWVVEVTRGRVQPVPECGADPATAVKSAREVVVSSVEETDPAS